MKPKEVKRKAAQSAKRTDYYKVLNSRKYRNVPGYISYEDVALELAVQLMSTEVNPKRAKEGTYDNTWADYVHTAYLAYTNPTFPVFGLTPDLAQALTETDLPKEYCPLNRVFEIGLILIPESLGIRSPDGALLKWILVTHSKKGDEAQAFSLNYHNFASKPITVDKLKWTSQVGDYITYRSCCEILEDGGLGKPNFTLHDKFKDDDIEVEERFTHSISKLVLNTLLYLQLTKSEVSPDNSGTPKILTKGAGFGKSNELEPIWIGKDYKRKVSSGNGTHASPTMHTRRGHMRYYRQEKGWKEDKLVWIEPTLVNG
jgi:hypothetical protein